MVFVRTKEIPPGSGNLYLYRVESYREGGKVKQRVLKYLGPVDKRGAAGDARPEYAVLEEEPLRGELEAARELVEEFEEREEG